MGEKKMSKKFLGREGFYIVLFVCLCIVAVTAVYFSKNNSSTQRKISQNGSIVQQPSSKITNPVTKGNTNAVVTSKQPVKSVKDAAKEMTTKKSSSKKHVGLFSSKNLKLSYPVQGEITKKFDDKELQYSKTMNQWETHEGIDIACNVGTDVKAALDGKIVDVIVKDDKLSEGEKNGFGAGIVIDHGNGFRTEYFNLSTESLKLKKGDSVKKSQVIGCVGDTSLRESVSIEGSHLCFSVLKKNGKEYVPVNPQQFLK